MFRLTSKPLIYLSAKLALIIAVNAQQQTVESIAAPDADHHLFSGVDLFVSDKGKLVPITSLGTKYVVIAGADGGAKRIDANQGFVWKITAKVSSVGAVIDELESKPIFSPENDPYRAAFASQVAMAEYNANFSEGEQLVQQAARDAIAGNIAANSVNADGSPALGGGPPPSNPNGPQLDTFEATGLDYDYFQRQIREAEESGAHDALAVTFRLSPSTDLADVHAIVLVRIIRDDEIQNLNFISGIGSVTTEGRDVRLMRTGIKPGFELLDTDVFVFNHDQEIATNLSERRMALTAQDAWEFARLSHQTDHRRSSAQPMVIWSLAPDALREATDADSFDWPLTLQLDERGVVQSIDDGGKPLPPLVRKIASQLPCLPAVENGQPVPAKLRVNLVEYFPPR